MEEFNVNDEVMVRLTDHGRCKHRSNWRSIAKHCNYPYKPPEEDKDGWSKWQLWELMREFGQHTAMGCPLCFETTIRLLPPQQLPIPNLYVAFHETRSIDI